MVLGASWGAGLAAFVGGAVSALEWSEETQEKPGVIRGVVAFGGGILLAAVAFALAPEGMAVLHPALLLVVFLAGGLVFCCLDEHLARQGGSKAQLLAMLMDFVPEAISLGAVFAHNHRLGLLLAAFIAAQNLPEGFNSFRELRASGKGVSGTLFALAVVSLLGPAAAALGYLFLQNREAITGGIMSFAAGGILYLIFQDIAPQATMRRSWLPPLGAVLGFAFGMLGTQLLG